MYTGHNRRTLTITSLIIIALLTLIVMVNKVVASRLALPERLSKLNLLVTLTDKQIEKLNAGQPVSKLLNAAVDYEVAVFGAAWIDTPAPQYIKSVENIEEFEKGESFPITKRLSDPPNLDDFAAVDLTDQDATDLKMCRVGACKLKMGRDAIVRVGKEIESPRPTAIEDAATLFRRVLFDYTIAYQQGGNAQLPVYQDKRRSTSVANEFLAMVDETPALLQYAPPLREYLIKYPNAQLSNGTSFFYWQEVDFGLKPTFRINHVAISEDADNIVIASKLLYASHYIRAALELQMLVPDSSRGSGFWLVVVKRLRSDGLSGSTGDLIRTRIQNQALKGLVTALRETKFKLKQNDDRSQ